MLNLWEKYLLDIRKSGSSCGAVIEVRARGIPVGLGAPIYYKLDMDIASAMMSINAVKGCLLYTSPSPRDGLLSRMPSSA